MKELVIHLSAIHGKGIFASEGFKKGAIISPIGGDMYELVVESLKDTLSYPNWIGVGHNKWIDPATPFAFINHSCNPSTGIISTKEGKLFLVAMKNLKDGDEFTIDYSTTEGDLRWKMDCSCKSGNCRGTIGSIDTIPREQYMSYLPYVQEYFQKLYASTHKRENRVKRELHLTSPC
jgi:uncharacterized protein